MKKISNYMLLLLLFVATTLQAQDNQMRRPLEERIETQRIAFITEKVSLTPSEAQSFWPVYKAFRDSVKDLRDQKIPAKAILDMNDSEAQAFLDDQMRVEKEELDLKIALTEDLKTILSPRKILRFYAAERLFKERLLQMINQRKRANANKN